MTQFAHIHRATSAPAFHAASPASELAEQALETLIQGRNIDQPHAHALFARLVSGDLPEPLIAAVFVSLRLKGETAVELTGAALALRAAARPFDSPNYLFADSCGTGGDGSGSINVSTAAALVAAACGLPVVKHGNRAVTSRCGSADVLEALGARLDLTPEQSRRAVDQTGFCFLLAPLYHPGIAHAGPVRRALKVRTVMNILGPCLNPARPPVQLLGVAEERMLRPVAETLCALGLQRALVVHGSGLDEVALHGSTKAVRLIDGELEEIELSPELAGLRRQPLEAIGGGDPAENAQRLKAVLSGGGDRAEREVIAINAGALLMTAGKAPDLRDGSRQALEALGSGAAGRVLEAFIEACHE